MKRLSGILVATILISVIFNIDKTLTEYFYANLELNSNIIKLVSFWTDYLALTLYLLICFYFLKRFSYEDSFRPLILIFSYYSIIGICSLILKNLIGRMRPVMDIETILQLSNQPFNFKFMQTYDWQFASLPSGHTVVSFSLAIALSRLYPKLTILFLLTASLITASRLIMLQHWLTDILFSILLVLLLDNLIWNRLSQLILMSGKKQKRNN